MQGKTNGLPMLLSGLITLIGAASLFAQTPAANGQIQGTIVANGQPVPKATVLVQLQGAPQANRIRSNAFTNPDGTFVVSGLPPGTFTICIQVPGGALLNPCTWSANPPRITVASGQTVSAGTIQLETGQLLRVRLNDTNRLLQADEGRTAGANVQIGVWTANGFFIPMRVRTKGPNARTLELPVPTGMQVELSVGSGFYDLTDENNTRLDPARGASLPIQAAGAAASRVYTFNVVGRKAASGQP